MSRDDRADVVIVGSGIHGSIVARALAERRPGLDILILDAGPVLTPERPGANLKDVGDLTLREELQIRSQGPDLFSYGVDALRERARTVVTDGSLAVLVRAGTFLASRAGHDADEMPALAMSTNVGGMGAHWTCACPDPGGDELSPDVSRDDWERAWGEASRYLSVDSECFPASPVTDWILERLQAHADVHRRPRRMPMSRHPRGRWGSPATILDGVSHRVRAESLCTRVLLEDGAAGGARVRDLRDGREWTVRAPIVVVAADSLRTPQLLHASGIRPWALGRFLNEHARILSRLPLAGSEADALTSPSVFLDHADPMLGSLWIPYDPPVQPFHVQVSLLDLGMIAGAPSKTAAGMAVGLSTLVPTEIRSENRLEFSDDAEDCYGMPAFRVHYARTPADTQAVERAVADQVHLQEILNSSTAGEAPAVMPAGSSLHYSGTVRSGGEDDGQSVCDTEGRVWGVEGLYVASNGVVPTALAHNVTPSGAGFAVRTAAAIDRALP